MKKNPRKLLIVVKLTVRSVGVSNFNVHHLEGLRLAGRPTPDPAVNQIELHPFFHQQTIVDYCLEHGIAVNGYCPLAHGETA